MTQTISLNAIGICSALVHIFRPRFPAFTVQPESWVMAMELTGIMAPLEHDDQTHRLDRLPKKYLLESLKNFI